MGEPARLLRRIVSGDFGSFAEKSDRDFFALAMIGAIALAPFAVANWLQGRIGLASMNTGIVLWFLVHGIALYRGRRLLAPALMFLPILGALVWAMAGRSEVGVFWAYPAILLFHFVLARRIANIYNVGIVLVATPLALEAFGPDTALRIAVTLVLTLIFANVFSYLTERQQKKEAEQERDLALERDRLALLVHATKAGFTDWDAENDVVIYSDRFKEMLGYPRDFDTAAWRSFFDLMHPEDRPGVQEVFRAMLRQKRSPGLQPPGQALDYRLRRADGSHVWVHAESLAQVDHTLRIKRFITSFQDITQFRDQEQALASERRRLELVVRAGNIGFLDWDGLERKAYYSPRFREILGFPPDADTSGWPDYYDMIHPEDRPRVEARFRRHILEERGEEHEATEYRLRRADGSYVWVEAVGLSVRNEKGYATRFIASIRDISEQRAEEERRLTEQRRLDLVVQAARVGIVDWDGRTKQAFYSPRFLEIVGLAPDAPLPADYFQAMVHPQDRARVEQRWLEFIRGRGVYYEPHQYRLRRADGSYVWVQASGVAVRDARGYVARWIAAVNDISEQRAHEEALRETVRLREEVERMSRHDLKTPLNSIIAVPRLLREGRKLRSEEHELLNIVERAGYRILNLVNLSLDLVRMEQGRYVFRPQVVDLEDLAGKVIADLESQAATKGVQILLHSPAEPVFARAEELLCYSMLANLLKNAVEASPEGRSVTVTVERNRGALVHVHNHGEVAESVRESFFEKYSTAGKPGGMGLGTYSALLMARVQQGNITMQTSAQAGTTLTIVLAEAPAGAEPALAGAATPAARLPSRPPELPPLDVLVVDDDEFNRLVMRRYLPSPPLKVTMAVNGRAALDALGAKRFDYVFLDLEMPVMSGYEAAARLRELERDTGRQPSIVVAFSSNDDEGSIKRALDAGCDHYLTKPAPRETLWRILAGSASARISSDQPSARPSDPVEIDADLRPTLPGFFLSRRETLDELGTLLARGERAAVRRLAHKLAGSFSLYGFKWAAAECRLLEHGAESGDAATLAARIAAVRTHLDDLRLRFVERAQA